MDNGEPLSFNRITPTQQRFAIVGISAALLLFHVVDFLSDPRPLVQRAGLPILLQVTAAVCLPWLWIKRNWACRAMLIVTFVWSLSGCVAILLQPRISTVVTLAVAILVFGWLVHPTNRLQFTYYKRTWGFARVTAGSWVLVTNFRNLIAPTRGAFPVLKAQNEEQAAGMVFASIIVVCLCLWLIWTGVQRERSASIET